ncbi:hypothetical protein D3C85_1734790 [compost metagenome]
MSLERFGVGLEHDQLGGILIGEIAELFRLGKFCRLALSTTGALGQFFSGTERVFFAVWLVRTGWLAVEEVPGQVADVQRQI